MSTDTDLLMERRKSRRRALVWKLLTVVLAVALLSVLAVGDPSKMMAGGAKPTLFDGKHIARVKVEGLIIEDRWRDELLEDLADDDKVEAVMVYINSPGGTVVGGENLYLGLGRLAEQKPVVAVMGSTATSAAYMTAIATDRIFAREGTLTGSIGVIMQTADVTGLMEKIGVKPEVIKSGPFKAQPNPMEPVSDEARAHIQGVVMDMHAMFVDMVASGRGLERDRVLGLADGRVFTGRQAIQEGLVDAIGGETQARDWLVAEKGVAPDTPIVTAEPDYPQLTLAERLVGAVGGQFGKALLSERVTLDGLLAVWHPGL